MPILDGQKKNPGFHILWRPILKDREAWTGLNQKSCHWGEEILPYQQSPCIGALDAERDKESKKKEKKGGSAFRFENAFYWLILDVKILISFDLAFSQVLQHESGMIRLRLSSLWGFMSLFQILARKRLIRLAQNKAQSPTSSVVPRKPEPLVGN